MILYYKPGACSLASHIVLTEINAEFEIVKVDTQQGITETGLDFHQINPKKYVPAFTINSGEILTEGPSILQYLADQAPQTELLPPLGTLSRARVIEHLTYTNSELHKAFGPLFKSDANDKDKVQAKTNISEKFNDLDRLFADSREYLEGAKFSIADAYLFVVCNWSNFIGIELDKWPHLAKFVTRISSRPSVKSAMHSEGLI